MEHEEKEESGAEEEAKEKKEGKKKKQAMRCLTPAILARRGSVRKDAEDKREGPRGDARGAKRDKWDPRMIVRASTREKEDGHRRDKSPNMLGNSPDKYISILRSAISPDFRHIIEPTHSITYSYFNPTLYVRVTYRPAPAFEQWIADGFDCTF
ncbi:hypothetical protein EAG_09936 [Camponotus floridanus]|uniref:Uncharacterized protein n=1 Tax=Camponotus floridanus TaxID=104421 RepID=E2A6G0_CAMFO|nr:hypothetical protein EAG_09936 [Camponotus floridanus]